MTNGSTRQWIAALALVAAAGCTPAPEPIRYGEDACAHCKMTASDARYGAELVTHKGKVYKFDAVECLTAYLDAGQVDEADVHAALVADFTRPGTLVPAEDAVFLHSDALRSPMGMNVTAFGPGTAPEAVRAAHGGETHDWASIRVLARQRQAHGTL